MVYLKKIQLCLFVLCSLVILNVAGVSSRSITQKENEAINDENEKLGKIKYFKFFDKKYLIF